MKTYEKKVYSAPQMEVLIVELEQGIASASTSVNTPSVDDSYGQGSGGSAWSGDGNGF